MQLRRSGHSVGTCLLEEFWQFVSLEAIKPTKAITKNYSLNAKRERSHISITSAAEREGGLPNAGDC